MAGVRAKRASLARRYRGRLPRRTGGGACRRHTTRHSRGTDGQPLGIDPVVRRWRRAACRSGASSSASIAKVLDSRVSREQHDKALYVLPAASFDVPRLGSAGQPGADSWTSDRSRACRPRRSRRTSAAVVAVILGLLVIDGLGIEDYADADGPRRCGLAARSRCRKRWQIIAGLPHCCETHPHPPTSSCSAKKDISSTSTAREPAAKS